MRNIKLIIAYLGTGYCGWQAQRFRAGRAKGHSPSIQATIEKALSTILQEKITIIGSGRTDAGVHARAQTANFYTQSRLKAYNIHLALHSLLPGDIVIRNVEDAGENFHARYSAKGKIYRYTIDNRKFPDVFIRHTAYHVPYILDIKAMSQSAKYLLGRHDFRAFQGRGSRGKPAVRTIELLQIHGYLYDYGFHPGHGTELVYNGAGVCQPAAIRASSDISKGGLSAAASKSQTSPDFSSDITGGIIYIDIAADGFLHNMARRIVGLLLEAGRGKIKPARVKEILASKDRRLGGPNVPAHGLCLMRVEY